MSAYDPTRISKISTIMPNLINFCRPGDQIRLGLDGDPAFDDSYRGSTRPHGTITRIEGETPHRQVHIQLSSGREMTYEEGETSARKVFELTDEGYRNVLERTKAEAMARNGSSADVADDLESKVGWSTVVDGYRGTSRSLDDVRLQFRGTEASISQLKEQMSQMTTQMDQFASSMINLTDGMTADIVKLSNKIGNPEPTFAGALQTRMRGATEGDDDNVDDFNSDVDD